MRKLMSALAGWLLLIPAMSQLPSVKYSSEINPAALKEKLSFIAGNETEGRATATHGQRVAAAYIENHFRKLGLLPGTKGGFQMSFPVYQDTLMDFAFRVNDQSFKLNKDISLSVNWLVSHYMVEDSIVYVQFGIEDSSRNDFAGLDIKGKWVLALEGNPANFNKTSVNAFQLANQLEAKMNQVKKRGGKGLMLVSRNFPRPMAIATVGTKYVKKSTLTFPLLWVSPAVAGSLLSMKVDSLAQLQPVQSAVVKTKLESYAYKYTKTFVSTNVLGVLPGSPKTDEYMFITAHYDHLGMRNGVMYPGADDDGSGTTAVLQMAEAFAKAKTEGFTPKRNIVFMTVSGEEMGLLGSEFYTNHPIYPLAKTSVNLNIDMVGRIDPKYAGDSMNYVYVIGDDRLSSDLRTITDSVNQLIKMELDRRFNGNDPQRYYFRSDHYNFAKNGVPIIFYFNGTHPDYHRPTDTIDKINFDLMSKRVQLVFHTAWIMAHKDEMLKRDIPMK